MSFNQTPYHYSDTSPIHHVSDSGVAPQRHHPGQSCPPTPASGDHSSHNQPHQSFDPVGNLLEAHDQEVHPCHNFGNATIYLLPPSDLQDMNYSYNQPHPDYLPSTSAIGTGATHINDHIPFHPFSNLPFYYYPEFDYRYSQNESGYTPHEPVYDYPKQPSAYEAHHYGNPAQDIHTSQASQGPSGPVYVYSLPIQEASLNHAGPVYQIDTTAARPNLTLDVVNTAKTELLNAGTRRYSYPSTVAMRTSPSNQTPAPGSSHPPPSSPERKRILPLSADDEPSTARRVVPRHDRAWSVHSTPSDSRGRRRSNPDVYGRGPLIPQERYTTSSISSHNAPDQHDPITFNLENPDQTGILITDILSKSDSFARIQDRTQAFDHMGGKKTFTLRVQWPGYKPWSKTIAALDWKKMRTPITRVKLAEAVAKGVQNLIESYRDESYDPDYAEWNVGPDGIQLDRICLVALHHVSTGSWQPELCLLHPRC